jgi:creatinine amidohydrolase
MSLPKRNWMDMTWQEVAGADTGRWIAVLPLAAVEQHGPHLPLGVDTYIGEAYLARVGKIILPVTFLPAAYRRFGRAFVLSRYADFRRPPRSLHGPSSARAWRGGVKLVDHQSRRQCRRHGNRRGELRTRLGMLAVIVGWHRFGYPDGVFDGEEKRHGTHAGDVETSLMLAAKSDTVRMDKAANAAMTVALAKEFKWLGAYRPAGFAWMTQDHPAARSAMRRWRRRRKVTPPSITARGVRGIASRNRPLRSFAAQGCGPLDKWHRFG